MEFVNILHSLEDAMYEVVMWVVLLPKTLVRVVAHPDWIQPYVTAEWGKEADKRFQGYLSPMLFWFLLGILPYAIWNPSTNAQAGQVVTFAEPVQSTFLWDALILVIFPTYYAIVLQRLRGEPIEREAVRRLFYIECYVHTPVALLGLPLTILVLSFANQYNSHVPLEAITVNPNMLLAYLGLIGLWVFLVESVIIHAELKTGWPRAIWLSLLYGVIGFVLMFFFLMISGLVLLL